MTDFFKSLFAGGVDKVITSVTDGLDKLFTSDEERMLAERVLLEVKQKFDLEKDKLDKEFDLEIQKMFDERTLKFEGTASDLKGVPILGSILLFLRGSQRIVWGYGTIFMDFQVFSGLWVLQDDALKSAFWIINFLVLGFLFGERTLKNVLPIAIEFFKTYKGKG